MRIGILSDTHGLLRPQTLVALQGVEHILHAGDVGNFDFLQILSQIAPVTAIRGNIDTHGPCASLSATEMLVLAQQSIYMVHSIHDLDIKPTAARIHMVVSGHSHKPSLQSKNGVIYLNPGSCGPRRFNLPVTIAVAEISQSGIDASIVALDV